MTYQNQPKPIGGTSALDYRPAKATMKIVSQVQGRIGHFDVGGTVSAVGTGASRWRSMAERPI